MEERILELCLAGMNAYNNANGMLDLGEAADEMAYCMENIMRVISERSPEVADEVDEYFKQKSGEDESCSDEDE